MSVPPEIITTIAVAALGSSGLWTVINGIVQAVLSRKKKDPVRDMVLGLGYDRLVHVCDKYIKQGWIDPDDLRDINKYLYEPYRELGGNGTAEMLFEKVKKLPSEG